uniref:Metalloendopeptidase n=1 Tax=Parastrongyloides trichosuri TaxID=131310 RepID=A0A0N4ZJP7_PARTI
MCYGGILNDTNRQWRFPINYKIEYKESYDYIDSAISFIAYFTCVTFKENKSLEYNQQGIIFKSGDYTYSDRIGTKENNNSNIIYISHKDKYNYIVIQGLILNALGVFPEQTRNDRDNYVNIEQKNVKDYNKNKIYFEKNTNLTYTPIYDTQYDYGSVIKKTITAKGYYGDQYQKMMGQKKVVTFNDYKIVNRHFCKQKCNNTLYCHKNGYQNPNKCNQCICPFPFTNNDCNGLLPNSLGSTGCPGRHVEADRYQTYGYTISGKKSCYGYISAPQDRQVRFTLVFLNMAKHSVCTRGTGSVEIKYKSRKDVMGLCFCGHIPNPYKNIYTEDGLIVFIYNGASSSDRFKYEYISAIVVNKT